MTGLEWLEEQITYPFVSCVEVESVCRSNLSHKCGNASLPNLLQYQMEVVWHKAERANGNEFFATRNIQYLFKLAFAYIVTPEREFVICQVQKFEEAMVLSRIFKCDSLFNTAIIAMVPLAYSKRDVSLCHIINYRGVTSRSQGN